MFISIALSLILSPASFEFDIVASRDSDYRIELVKEGDRLILGASNRYSTSPILSPTYVEIEIVWDNGEVWERERIQVPLIPGKTTTVKLRIPRRQTSLT